MTTRSNMLSATMKKKANAALAVLVAFVCAVSLFGIPAQAVADESQNGGGAAAQATSGQQMPDPATSDPATSDQATSEPATSGQQAPGQAASGQPDSDQQASKSIHGVDYLYTQNDRQQNEAVAPWELLRLQGYNAGEVLYVDIYKTDAEGKKTLMANHKQWTVPDVAAGDDGEQATDAEGNALGEDALIAQIFEVIMQSAPETPATVADIYGKPTSDRYGITVWSAQRGGAKLYDGTIYPIYAALEGQDEPVVLGIRTASTDASGSGASEAESPRNVGAGPMFYKTVGEEQLSFALVPNEATEVDNTFDENGQCYFVKYDLIDSDAVTGTVNYVDAETGSIVRSDEFPNITNENPAKAHIQKSFYVTSTGDAGEITKTYYRTVSLHIGSVELTPAAANATVRVMKVDNLPGNAYEVTVKYVEGAKDADGKFAKNGNSALLWSDTLNIHGDGYRYTLPTTFSMAGKDGVEFYTLENVKGGDTVDGESGETKQYTDWGNPVAFDKNTLTDASYIMDKGARTLEAGYVSSETTKEAQFTIVEVDGSTNTVLDRKAMKVTPEVEATYTPAPFERDGVKYVPWISNTQPITYTWESMAEGQDLMRYIYYVPEDYKPGDGYDITVNYVNVVTGDVIRSDTHYVDPDLTDYLTVIGDERIEQDGEEYVRLAGQERGINHTYFTPDRTYTIWYRNVNDTIDPNTYVVRTQIIDAPAPGGDAPGAFTTTITTAPTEAAEGAAAGGVTAGDGAAVIDDEANPLAGLDGTDTSTERAIEDSENPLSSGESGAEALSPAAMAGIGAGILALAAVIFYLLRRRKKQQMANETTNA